MSYLQKTHRDDPPFPRVCVTKKGKIIFLPDQATLTMKILPGPNNTPGILKVEIDLEVNYTNLPAPGTITCLWKGVSGPGQVQGQSSNIFDPQDLQQRTISVSLSDSHGTSLGTLFAGV